MYFGKNRKLGTLVAGLFCLAAGTISSMAQTKIDFYYPVQVGGPLTQVIDGYTPDTVVLAGFMRILTSAFVAHYSERLLNIHPSLLPAFPGLDTHQRAMDAGCKVAGATVHVVTADLDAGPILAQAVVPVLPGDSAETLAARVLTQEHIIYPQAVLDWVLRKP